MRTVTRFVDAVLRVFMVLVFTVLVACVVWQVISRYVLGAPSTLTDEAARFLFIWIGLIGAAYTLGRRRHLAIDLLAGALTGRAKLLTNLCVIAAIAAFAALVMVYGGWQLMTKTLATGQVSPALRLPMGYVYGAIPFSGLVILYYCAVFLLDVFREPSHGPNDRLDVDSAAGNPLD